MSEPLISVIVPVYNMEKYLDECVASILGQTYSNFELILIDDGSKDSSAALIDTWAKKDDRVIAIHNQNEGVSVARNTGIDIARGEYLVFVDSDDYVAPEYIEVLVQAAKDANADMAMCGMYALFRDVFFRATSMPGVTQIFSPQKYMESFYINTGFFSVAWNKIYKKQLFDTVRFLEGRLNEDTIIMPQLIAKANKVAYVAEPLYFYRQRQGSIMHAEKREQIVLNLLNIYEELIQLHEQKKEMHLCRLAQKVYLNKSFEYFSDMRQTNRLEIRKKQKKYCGQIVIYAKFPILVRVKMIVFTLLPNLYCIVYKRKTVKWKCFE